jgi:hypothetical protein
LLARSCFCLLCCFFWPHAFAPRAGVEWTSCTFARQGHLVGTVTGPLAHRLR